MTAAVVLAVDAAPASAHTVSGQGATNFRTVISAVSPAVPGLTVRSVELGSRLSLTWTGPDQLVVLGYDDEPYLRVGPDGIFRNRLSPATYLNVTRSSAGITVPPDADSAAATAHPQWVRIGGGRTVSWHDHRTHWMGGTVPLPVRRSPATFHKVFDWHVGLVQGGRPVTVTGQLDWVPGSSPWPWVAAIVALAAVGLAAGLGRRWAPVLLGLTAVLVGADVLHAVGTGLAFAGSPLHRLLLIIGSSYYSIAAWALGVVAIRLLARRSVDGLFAAVLTALVIGLFGGLADVVSLSRSQIPFAFAPVVARLLVSVSIGVAVGVIGGSLLAFRRNRPPPTTDAVLDQAPEDLGIAGARG